MKSKRCDCDDEESRLCANLKFAGKSECHCKCHREARISFLERMKETTKADLLMKFGNGDWHGVADAAMDLRDIIAELAGLRF